MKTERLLAHLAQLGFVIIRQNGSHRQMYSDQVGRQLTLSFHDGREVSATAVKKVLMTDVGLSEADALALVTGRRRK